MTPSHLGICYAGVITAKIVGLRIVSSKMLVSVLVESQMRSLRKISPSGQPTTSAKDTYLPRKISRHWPARWPWSSLKRTALSTSDFPYCQKETFKLKSRPYVFGMSCPFKRIPPILWLFLWRAICILTGAGSPHSGKGHRPGAEEHFHS